MNESTDIQFLEINPVPDTVFTFLTNEEIAMIAKLEDQGALYDQYFRDKYGCYLIISNN